MIVDYHMHLRGARTEIAHDTASVDPFVAAARAVGVDEIGFTEHGYYFRQTRRLWTIPFQVERCVYDLDTYVDAVVEAKRQGLPVKLGLEVDYVGELQPRLAELLAPYPWDFLLGSVHWIDGLAVDQEPGIWAGRSVEAVWRLYFEALAELASGGHVDVLAHADLAKIFDRRPDDPAGFYPPLDGVAVEISTAGLRKRVGELYPDAALLASKPPITLASDAHRPDDVGVGLDRCLRAADEAGYTSLTRFRGRERQAVPLG